MTSPPPKAALSAIWLALLGAMTALGPMSIDLYLPAFGLIEQDLGLGVEHSLAAYLFGVAIGQLIYGPVSDHFGRKPPLYVALLLYVAGSLACGSSSSMKLLVLWRFTQALGGCAGMVIARAIVRDRCEAHEAARVFSTLIMITAVAPILAPLLGSYIATLGNWRMVFLVQAGFGLCLLIAVHWLFLETRKTRATRGLKVMHAVDVYLSLLRDRAFVCYALISAFSIATIFCYICSAPTVFIRDYGLSPQHLALLMGAGGLSFVVASQLNVQRLRTRTPAQVLSVAVWVPLLLAGILFVATFQRVAGLPFVFAIQVAIFMAIAHIAPNVSAQALAAQGERAGAASALLGSIQSIGSTLAGAATGLFVTNICIMALLMLICACAVLVTYRVLVIENRKRLTG